MVNLSLQTQACTFMFILYFWKLDFSTVLLVCEDVFLSVLIVFMMVAAEHVHVCVVVDFISHESLYMQQVGIGFQLLWKAISISNRFLLTTSIQRRDISLLFFS